MDLVLSVVLTAMALHHMPSRAAYSADFFAGVGVHATMAFFVFRIIQVSP